MDRIYAKELGELMTKLYGMANDFNKRDRKKITRGGATIVANKARQAGTPDFPDSKRKHYRYRSNEQKVTYYPGNLRRSVRVVPRLRNTLDSFVGPIMERLSGTEANVYGRGRAFDGFYAAMRYRRGKGSGKIYNRNVLQKAARLARGSAISRMVRDSRKALVKRGIIRGLNIR